MVRQLSIDGCNITARWFIGLASMVASSPSDGTSGRHRWLHHDHQAERWAGVDGGIITSGQYVGPTSMDASSPPNGTPSQYRWMHHHRWMVRRAVDGRIVTAGRFAGPTVVTYRHRQMLRQTDGGKIPSPSVRSRRR